MASPPGAGWLGAGDAHSQTWGGRTRTRAAGFPLDRASGWSTKARVVCLCDSGHAGGVFYERSCAARTSCVLVAFRKWEPLLFLEQNSGSGFTLTVHRLGGVHSSGAQDPLRPCPSEGLLWSPAARFPSTGRASRRALSPRHAAGTVLKGSGSRVRSRHGAWPCLAEPGPSSQVCGVRGACHGDGRAQPDHPDPTVPQRVVFALDRLLIRDGESAGSACTHAP